jgi:uncharacterized protein YxeA
MKILSSILMMVTLGTFTVHAATIAETEQHLQREYQAAQSQNNARKLDAVAQEIVLHCHRLYKNEGPHAKLGSSSDDKCIARLIGSPETNTSSHKE